MRRSIAIHQQGEANFLTESQAFAIKKGEEWQRKVVTLVFPSHRGPHKDETYHDDDWLTR